MGDEQRITRPAVERALLEFRAVGRVAFLAKYGFGPAREYFVRDPVTGELADSKAIAGAAYGYAFPEAGALKPSAFSGGAATVEARMNALGFQVTRAKSVWTDSELALVIRDYFEMLQREVLRFPYVATDHLHRARRAMSLTSTQAVTIIYQQISGALQSRGLPTLPGFQPRDNFSIQLKELLQRYLSENARVLRTLLSAIPSGSIYQINAELALPDAKIITDLSPQLQIASSALVEQLKGRADRVHDLTPRQFEELIAELLTDMGGGRVEITPYSCDGGKDLLAYVDLQIGRLLCLIEAKKYSRDRPVEVQLVRSLYGVVAAEDASHGTLITTSSFSKGARQFQSQHKHRLSLRDYTHVAEWIRCYGRQRQ